MSAPTPPPCGTCHGQGGTVNDTSSGGITRQNWQTCQPCHGTGVQGGGR